MERGLEIVVLSGVSAGDVFRFQLSKGDSVKIGRADENDMVLADPRVSRLHAGIQMEESGDFRIYDLGSAGGTVHMGFKLASGYDGARTLSSGDEFKVGDSLFRAQFEALAEDESGSDQQPEKEKTRKSLLDNPQLQVLKKKPIVAALALIAVLLLVLAFYPSGKKSSFYSTPQLTF